MNKMNAVIKIPSSEFNEDVFKKIGAMIMSFGNSEITIAVSNNNTMPRKESKEEYWDRVNKSIEEIGQGKGVTFTMDELEGYIHNLVSE